MSDKQWTVTRERAEFRRQGVTLRGDLLHVEEPLGMAVLLHGGGQTRHSWSGTAEALAQASWATLSLDARGHGESEWAPDGDYSLDVQAQDLCFVLSSLRAQRAGRAAAALGRPVLIGASMGGMTSLIAEGELGPVARALVLVDVVPRIEPEGVARIMSFMNAHLDGFASLEAVADAVAAYNPSRRRGADLSGLKKNVRLQADGRWYWHWDPALLKLPTEEEHAEHVERMLRAAGRVQAPTLVVRGAESDVVSDSGVQELLSHLRDGSTVSVAAAGHMVAGDENTAFSRAILNYLAQLPRA